MAPALLTLGQSLIDLGRLEQAERVLKLCLQHDPYNDSARFFLAAATGATVPVAPFAFVTRLFDHYAPRFDQHLLGQLSYRVPELMRAAIDGVQPTGQFDILDLGCGTGLVGARLHDRARSLGGVDLSRQMLAITQQRGIYQYLEHGDLLSSLRRAQQSIDLILAGDVFIYVGDLNDIFAATRQALRSGGLFAFSIELHAGEGFVLRSTRRYAHSRTYVESLAARTGFVIASAAQADLRHEHQKAVEGVIYVLRRS